ncbi:MAG: hypothetical protein DRO36_06640 [Candidatus Hecatellales archaeon]|nr:MAG: hypothetical protein DRO36_06640 [Candidatus Hecatellales archaeon]
MLAVIKIMGLSPSKELAFAAVAGLVGSTLPDIDIKFSGLSRTLGHRGIVHTVWVPSGVVISYFLLQTHRLLDLSALFFAVGWLTHLIADSITPQGIRPFYPLYSGKIVPRGFGIFQTGSFYETLFQFINALIIAIITAGG